MPLDVFQNIRSQTDLINPRVTNWPQDRFFSMSQVNAMPIRALQNGFRVPRLRPANDAGQFAGCQLDDASQRIETFNL